MKKKLSFYLIPKIHLTYKFIISNIKQNKNLGKNLEQMKMNDKKLFYLKSGVLLKYKFVISNIKRNKISFYI